MIDTASPPIPAWSTWTGAQFSTYRLGGPLKKAFCPMTQAEALDLLDWLVNGSPQGQSQFVILGWGSNTIIADAGISVPCVIFRKLTDIKVLDHNRIRFGAGVHLAKVSKTALDLGLSGGEFMVGIPGTMGGAIRMNAGATGQETGPLVVRVTLYNLETAQVETWTPEKLAFSYRHSAIDPQRHVVLSAELLFQPGNPDEIKALMEKNRLFRQTHHPIEPNGGSVFRNPVKVDANAPEALADSAAFAVLKTAGQMLDELGAKSWVEDGVRVSPRHANFIVNTGGGSSVSVLRLMRRMQHAVEEAYGIRLRPENLFLGDATEEESGLWRELTQGATY